MISKYFNFINERLGVPEGNVESAQSVYDEYITFLKDLGNMKIADYPKRKNPITSKEDINFMLPKTLVIGDVKFKNTVLSILGYQDNDGVDIIGMSVGIKHSDIKSTRILYSKLNTIISISINVTFSTEDTFNDLAHFMESNKPKWIGILSHEIKHAYDKVMIGKEMFGDVVSYSAWTNVRFGVPAIDKFIFYLYLVSKSETLVRSSEIAGQLKELDVSKSEFREFLKSTDLWKQIKMMQNFSYKGMRDELLDQVDIIRKRLSESGMDKLPDDDGEVVDLILKLLYENILYRKVSVLRDVMSLDHPIRNLLNLITDEEREYYNKFIRKNVFKNPDDYFRYCEKLIKFVSGKVIKKISKLYDMCKDDKVNPIHKKIEDKSIVNRELHDKHVANDKVIKSFESFEEVIKPIKK